MANIEFTLNGKRTSIETDEATPLLWVLRENLGLTGTKYGCGIAMCGSCTVHIDGLATRSCVMPVSAVADKQVTTIEGLTSDNTIHAVQQAWIDEQVPQCGYCQSGQIMQAAALLRDNPNPTDDEIKIGMNGVLCRCGTYMRIMKAIKRASKNIRQ